MDTITAIDTVKSWTCHLHSSGHCSMRKEYDPDVERDRYYHVVIIKNISITAQSYNVRNNADEFWEDFLYVAYFSPIVYCTCINEYKTFQMLVDLFRKMDENNIKYSSFNTPADFMKKHIITDGSNITLCNKYLVKKGLSKSIQIFYGRDYWLKACLKILFPKIEATKDGIPTSTPPWAISIFASLKGAGQTRKSK